MGFDPKWVTARSSPQDKQMFWPTAKRETYSSALCIPARILYTVKVKNHCCLVWLPFPGSIVLPVWRDGLRYVFSRSEYFRVERGERQLRLSTLTNALWLTVSLCISVLITLPSLRAKIHRLLLHWICPFTLTGDDCSENVWNLAVQFASPAVKSNLLKLTTLLFLLLSEVLVIFKASL